jgi:hypothetical protein
MPRGAKRKKEATTDKDFPISFKCRSKPVLSFNERAALTVEERQMAQDLIERCVLVTSL